MNDDLISRQAAIEVIDAVLPVDPMKSEYAQGIACGAALAKTYVEQLPSAQPERKTAKFIRWMECKRTADYISYTQHCKCSKCGTEFLIENIKYCYMCGARMES